MSGRYVTVELEAEVDVLEALENLDGEALVEARRIVNGQIKHESDASAEELAYRLALAIAQRDGKAAADHAHRLCMELAGVAVLHEIHIGRAPWERQEFAA